ncbi:MAG: hypothetical protein Barrevirus11_4 [Barrevirus sp.]|uniref:Uncharacterized protein n=1 Tax=Barrevirus sp. TaxID=2487763 RepID=A0A3G4ZRX5_9VIRU|nr:MAG: hypothetical protein Barrevirus11_4 [Barrevirus sp.]
MNLSGSGSGSGINRIFKFKLPDTNEVSKEKTGEKRMRHEEKTREEQKEKEEEEKINRELKDREEQEEVYSKDQEEDEEEEEEEENDNAAFKIMYKGKPFNKTAQEVFEAIQVGTPITIISEGIKVGTPCKVIIDSSNKFKNAITFSASLTFDNKVYHVEITCAHSRQLSPIMKSKYCLTFQKEDTHKKRIIVCKKQIINNNTEKRSRVEEDEKEKKEEKDAFKVTHCGEPFDQLPLPSLPLSSSTVANPVAEKETMQQQSVDENQFIMMGPKAKYLELKANFMNDPIVIAEAKKKAFEDPRIIARVEEIAKKQAIAELEKRIIANILQK